MQIPGLIMARYTDSNGNRETFGTAHPSAAFAADPFFSDAVTTEIAAACGIGVCRHGKPADEFCPACIEDELNQEAA